MIEICAFVFSALSILITIGYTIYNWRLRRPNLKLDNSFDFYASYYFQSPRDLYLANVGYMAVVYIAISNLSELPITISKFKLTVKDSEDSFFLPNITMIEPELYVPVYESNFKPKTNIDLTYEILQIQSKALHLPLTLDSFDYVEGYAIFPQIPNYKEDFINAKIVAETARKSFSHDISLKRVNNVTVRYQNI